MAQRVESSKLEAKELVESDHAGSEDGSLNMVAPPPSRNHRRDRSGVRSESDLSTPPPEREQTRRKEKRMVLKRENVKLGGEARSRGSSVQREDEAPPHFEFSLSSEEETGAKQEESSYTLSPFLIIDRSQFETTPAGSSKIEATYSKGERLGSPPGVSMRSSPLEATLSKLKRRDTIVTLGPDGHGFQSISPGSSKAEPHEIIASAFNSEEQQGHYFFTPE